MPANLIPMQVLPAEPLRQFALHHDLDLALMPRLYDAEGMSQSILGRL